MVCYQGPFATCDIADTYYYPKGLPDWTSLKFTNNGKHILLSTSGQTHYILDAFSGNIIQRLSGFSRLGVDTCGEETGLSPDGRFVFSGMMIVLTLSWTKSLLYIYIGGRDGKLYIWDIENPNPASAAGVIQDNLPMTALDTPHTDNLRVFGFNPYYMMFVTGSDELVSMDVSLYPLSKTTAVPQYSQGKWRCWFYIGRRSHSPFFYT